MIGAEYTDIHSQFRSVNYIVFIKKIQLFWLKQTCVVIEQYRGVEMLKTKVNKIISKLVIYSNFIFKTTKPYSSSVPQFKTWK